jgi:hypothetical protein
MDLEELFTSSRQEKKIYNQSESSKEKGKKSKDVPIGYQ